MFDTIGRDLDDERNQRRAQSLLISVVGMGGVIGFVLGLGVYTAAELVAEEVDDDGPMVMIDLAEAPPDHAPPDLPPAPPKLQGVAAPDDAPPAPVPDPDLTPQLAPPVERPIADSQPPAGDPHGRPDGHADGVDGGTPGGDPNGRPGGEGGGGGPQVFHHRELSTRVAPKPRYPDNARALNLGAVTCKARVTIDPRGRPEAVVVEHCPKVFHPETRETLLRWRWYPPKDTARRKVRAQTVIGITYRLTDGAR